MKKLSSFLLSCFIYVTVLCQNVGINSTGAAPNTSSMLDISATNKGLLIPRVSLLTTADVATISAPATSLLVYNINASISGIGANGVGFYYFDGSKWVKLISNTNTSTAWLTTGNSGSVDGTNFIGTTDNVPLNFRINNNAAGRIDSTNADVFLGSLSGGSPTAQYNTAIGHFALKENTLGTYNTAIGFEALRYNNNGYNNVAIGTSSMKNVGTGYSNVSIGHLSMGFFSNGNQNVAIGERAMYSSNCNSSVGIGYQALQNNTQFGTVALGYQAMQNNSAGTENTGIGYQSIQNNYNGSYNTAVGYSSLLNNTGNNNTAIGDKSMMNPTNGNYNTCLGTLTLNSAANPLYNVVIGNEAMGGFTTFGNENTVAGNKAMYNNKGSQNTAIGLEALYGNTADANTALGYEALRFNSSGNHNTAIGYQTLQANNYGNNNTAVGYNALNQNNNNSGNNTAIGNQALEYNSGSNNIGIGNQANSSGNNTENISIGNLAMYINSGNYNVAIGSAVMSNGKGDYNTAIGRDVLKNNVGNENVAIGDQSLSQNTNGYSNTAIGRQSLYQNSNGYNNTASGYNTLYSITSGNGNTAHGYYALNSLSTGNHNTGIGENAFQYLTSGNYITGIGYNTFVSNGLSNSTAIGAFATVKQDNSLVLGSIGGINGAFSNTTVGIGTTTPPNALSINNFFTDPATDNTYALAIQQNNSTDFTMGSDGNYVYQQAWNSKPLLLNSQGNNVGIGLYAAPAAKLHVSGAFVVDGAQTTHAQGAWLEWNKNGGGGKTYLLNQKGLGAGGFVIGEVSAANAITERISIDNNGYVGISNTTPNAPLQFANTTSNRKIVLYEAANNDHQFNGFGLNPGILRFQVNNTGDDFVYYAGTSSTTSNELMRIKGNGNVGIGGAPGAGQKLYVSGSGVFTGTVTASCGTLVCSDVRYKKDIQPLQHALSKVLQLKGVSYYFRKDEFKDKNFNDDKQIGLIAQEVEKIYPELVQTDAEGFKSVDYAKLTPILVEAIKELKQQNDTLKEDNGQLKTAVQKLEAKVDAIEKLIQNTLSLSQIIK